METDAFSIQYADAVVGQKVIPVTGWTFQTRKRWRWMNRINITCPYQNELHEGCCFRSGEECTALCYGVTGRRNRRVMLFSDGECHFYKKEKNGVNIYEARHGIKTNVPDAPITCYDYVGMEQARYRKRKRDERNKEMRKGME